MGAVWSAGPPSTLGVLESVALALGIQADLEALLVFYRSQNATASTAPLRNADAIAAEIFPCVCMVHSSCLAKLFRRKLR